MDTKERWTPVRRPVQFAGPELASDAATLCEKEMENAVTVSRASMNFLCRFDSRPAGESLHFLLSGRSETTQPFSLVTGQVALQ